MALCRFRRDCVAHCESVCDSQDQRYGRQPTNRSPPSHKPSTETIDTLAPKSSVRPRATAV